MTIPSRIALSGGTPLVAASAEARSSTALLVPAPLAGIRYSVVRGVWRTADADHWGLCGSLRSAGRRSLGLRGDGAAECPARLLRDVVEPHVGVGVDRELVGGT